MPPSRDRTDTHDFPMGLGEFVTLIAMTMAVQALGTDLMLPALPEIGRMLGTTEPNQQQWVVSIYLIGFGSLQILFGPLSDRFGRRNLMLGSLTCFGITCIIASMAQSFTMLLVSRFFMGVAGSASRVLIVSIVRDRFAGRQMARVMSLAMMIFLLGPMLAPTIGQAILLIGSWRLIFWALAGFCLIVTGWIWLRMPETLDPANRRAIDPGTILSGFSVVLRNRYSLGYTLGGTMTFGALLGFVASSQQIFAVALKAPDFFPFGFAFSSAALALAALVNSRIVERYGSRRVSHAALIGMILVSGTHLIWAKAGMEGLTSFVILQCSTMFFIGLIGSNFNAMAMEPMGAIAGTASALQGTISTLGASVIGAMIGQRFDGTATPIVEGFFLMALAALPIVLVTERGRLFRPHHPDPQ